MRCALQASHIARVVPRHCMHARRVSEMKGHLVDALQGGRGGEGVGDKQRGVVAQLEHLLGAPLAEGVLPDHGRAAARV